jgi:hypothetical protein
MEGKKNWQKPKLKVMVVRSPQEVTKNKWRGEKSRDFAHAYSALHRPCISA